MKTVDMETEYELGQKMIDAIIKEKVAAGCVSFLFLLLPLLLLLLRSLTWHSP